MNISERQQRAGAIWGVVAFAAGVSVAWWLHDPVSKGPSRLKRAIWLYLSSHYVSVGPIKVKAVLDSLPKLALVTRGSWTALWHAIPLFVTALAATGVNIGLGRTRNSNLMLQNSMLVLIGYLPAALIAAVWSGAAGAVGSLILIIAGAFLALAVGSSAVGGATRGTPVLGVTSLSALVVIGLIVLLGGWLVIRILIPVAVLGAGGAVVGTALVYAARMYV